MSLKKFGETDIILNTMKAHPSSEFFINDGKIYFNSVPQQAGAFTSQVRNVPPGHVSLYEGNIDRAGHIDISNPLGATATIIFNNATVAAYDGETITIKSTDGEHPAGHPGAPPFATSLAVVYTLDDDTTTNTYGATTTNIGVQGAANAAAVATTVQSAITNANNAHYGKITVSRDGATLSLTQAVPGKLGNSTVTTSDDTDITVGGFYGGRDAGPSGHAGSNSLFSTTNPFIYPYITKGSRGNAFKKTSKKEYNTQYGYGDVMTGSLSVTGSYPMSASITREFMSETAGSRSLDTNLDISSPNTTFLGAPLYPHFWALKNRLDFYGTRSEHYKVSSSFADKSQQVINLISVPSIFFGSRIKPGTLSLKWYLTGSLIGELRDTKHNGELIEVSGSNTDSVAGVVMYDEGFILLTGSWDLNHETIGLVSSSAPRVPVTSKWIYFGAGANDDVTATSTGSGSYVSASFDLSFKGETDTQVLTMFAHARRGEANYSNNPTFIKYGQTQLKTTSSQVYEENSSRTLYNTVSSSYNDYNAPFKRQVYVSRVAIYDENKNLIGIATLSNPVLKKEDEDLSFKLRLDI